MARIKVINHKEATGQLKTIYDDLLKSRGALAEVHKIQSLRPKSIIAHMDLYMEIMYSCSELTRAIREMIGTVVSAVNGCKYCVKHHSDALNHYWKNDNKIQNLINGKYDDILSMKELEICKFAIHLTSFPDEHENTDFTKQLRNVGLSDAGILDVVLVTAYFNFVNRIVLSLHVEIEIDTNEKYKY